MDKFDNFLKKVIKAILNDIKTNKENKETIKSNLTNHIEDKG